MTFAGYNAGRGRVRDWIKARGDPRDPAVDAVDWVERIPFSETRNYVQRVIENLGVYRVRFGTAHDRAPGACRKARAGAGGAPPPLRQRPRSCRRRPPRQPRGSCAARSDKSLRILQISADLPGQAGTAMPTIDYADVETDCRGGGG